MNIWKHKRSGLLGATDHALYNIAGRPFPGAPIERTGSFLPGALTITNVSYPIGNTPALRPRPISARHRECPAMEIRSCPLESAKAYFFDTATWGSFCDVTLTLKQAHQSDKGTWIRIDDYPCRQAFCHFMKLLNRAVFGTAFRRHGKRLRVLPVLEKGEVYSSSLRSGERSPSGRWHIHAAIELPAHLNAVGLEKLIRRCWSNVELGFAIRAARRSRCSACCSQMALSSSVWLISAKRRLASALRRRSAESLIDIRAL
jgi:hypothetical protein